MTRFHRQFWRYSSRTVAGYSEHPTTNAMRERVLNMWVMGYKREEIAHAANLNEETVRSYIRRARRKGDPRAEPRNHHWSKRSEIAAKRKRLIEILAENGRSEDEIARVVGVTPSLVKKRIRGQ